MHRFVIFSFIIAFSLSIKLIAAPNSCRKAIVNELTVPLSSLRPTQLEIGYYWMQIKSKKLLKKANKKNVLIEQYLASEHSSSVPAIKSPKGEYFILDSHHSISAIINASKSASQIKVRIRIIKDFSNANTSYEDFVNLVFTEPGRGGMGLAFFPSSTSNLPTYQKFLLLPTSFHDLKDSKIRSILGIIFKKNGIKGKMMNNYFQFVVGEELQRNGFKLPNDFNFSKANISSLEVRIFSDPSFMEFLTTLTKTKKARKIIQKLVIKYQ